MLHLLVLMCVIFALEKEGFSFSSSEIKPTQCPTCISATGKRGPDFRSSAWLLLLAAHFTTECTVKELILSSIQAESPGLASTIYFGWMSN